MTGLCYRWLKVKQANKGQKFQICGYLRPMGHMTRCAFSFDNGEPYAIMNNYTFVRMDEIQHTKLLGTLLCPDFHWISLPGPCWWTSGHFAYSTFWKGSVNDHKELCARILYLSCMITILSAEQDRI